MMPLVADDYAELLELISQASSKQGVAVKELTEQTEMLSIHQKLVRMQERGWVRRTKKEEAFPMPVWYGITELGKVALRYARAERLVHSDPSSNS